jgi:carboxyl-terminal processing protease
MNISFMYRSIASSILILATSCGLKAEQPMDFNEVGKQVSILLQNHHFAQKKWDTDLSKQFLDTYLGDLDFGKMYFLQSDIDTFKQKYADKLHTLLLQREIAEPANEIYDVFRKRAEERITFVKKILKEETFDFAKDESIIRSRKNEVWPKNQVEAENLWRATIKEAILSDTLRRETVARISERQGKENPLKNDKSPQEKVVLRYERLMRSISEVDDEDKINYMLSAVTKTFDPHTEYMGYREISRFKDSMRNQLVGIGALLEGEEDGATKIKGIVVGGPADRGGALKLNDRIVGVDSLNDGNMTDIMFMKIDKVVDLIRGKEATDVKLKVEPAGATPGTTTFITISRSKVDMKDEQASAQIIEKKNDAGVIQKIGWITLPSFYMDFDGGDASCATDVEKLLRWLVAENINGLIIDLRGNGGGSLDEVRKMVGFFIPRGPVVQVKDYIGKLESKNSDLREPIYKGPLVVMIDRTSASASEIMAGALQDHNRAVIVGDTATYGKGTVQQLMDVGRMMPFFSRRDRAGTVKVTLQKFYRPSGDSTQCKGVESDIVVSSMLDGLEVGETFMDHVLEFDRIRRAPDLKPLDRDSLFISRLQELNIKRKKNTKDLLYTLEDIAEVKKREHENKISLNKEVRSKELLEAEQKRQVRNDERKTRYEEMTKEDKTKMKFYKITLDDISKSGSPRLFDPSEENKDFMIRAKDATEDLDDAPKLPSGMDAVKRESINIVSDLIDVTDAARVAGILKKTSE